MLVWKRGHVTEFLRESLRRDGLGSHRHGPVCSTCLQAIPPRDTQPANTLQIFLTRCRNCFGDCVECSACCVARHSRMPLHRTEEWTGVYWHKRSLHSLGLVANVTTPPVCTFSADQYLNLN